MPETLQQAFEAELTRLTALHIPDDELELARRYYSQKEREGMSESSFCGPHRSFPITSQADVDNAAHLVGHADNPDAVKACIKRKAKANGWSLPKSWTDGKSDRLLEADLERARQAAIHAPMTGRHSHGHPHEIDGYAHEHSHEHQNDNMHDHEHMHANRALTTDIEPHMYVPITRIEENYGPEKLWMVEGQATSDQIDSYGTIFDFESSKRAFDTWRGNIREMHNPTRAVGHAIEWWPEEDAHAIRLRAFVSKGEPGTWEKVKDGTLSGFSIGVPKDGYKLKTIERNGKSIPMYYDHKLAEVSLVDNPGSPGCNVVIVRADGMATEVLDDTEEPPAKPENDLNRTGARISHVTQEQLHSMRDTHLKGAKSTMELCGCDDCNTGKSAMDPDGDGDIDLIPSSMLDWDNDGGKQSMNGAMNYNIEATITRHMQPLLSRMQAILSQHIQLPQQLQTQEPVELTRHIEAMETRFKSELGEVRSVLTEVKGLAEKIANTPLPGGPVATPVPVDKRLATQPAQGGYNPQNDIAAITRAAELGLFKDQDSQVNAAARIIAMQRQGQ
jgi:hypothetical protein